MQAYRFGTDLLTISSDSFAGATGFCCKGIPLIRRNLKMAVAANKSTILASIFNNFTDILTIALLMSWNYVDICLLALLINASRVIA